MIAGVPKETFPGERRVAVIPAVVPKLAELGLEVVIEAGAGETAGFPDPLYAEEGARVTSRTAGGTLTPARVFVIGAGVAGLQAIATARRLGAVVEGYDIRPAAREQIESLGARVVELPMEAKDAQDEGGYARAMDEEFYRRQRETMAKVVAASDVIICTAAIPGTKAPVLIGAEMVD